MRPRLVQDSWRSEQLANIVKGQRLEVNPSVDRYKREMANLSAAL
jgi:hypothetical protein